MKCNKLKAKKPQFAVHNLKSKIADVRSKRLYSANCCRVKLFCHITPLPGFAGQRAGRDYDLLGREARGDYQALVGIPGHEKIQ